MAAALWGFVFKMFGVDWVMARSVLDQLVGWRNWFGKHSSDIWNLDPLCVMWFLWRERNHTFENVEHSLGWLIEFCMSNLFDWSRAWGFTTLVSVGGFIESLRCTNPL